MNEAIAKLTRAIKEKDMQITTLMNRLELQHDEDVDPDLKKKENQRDDESVRKRRILKTRLKKNRSQSPKCYIDGLSFHPTNSWHDRKHH